MLTATYFLPNYSIQSNYKHSHCHLHRRFSTPMKFIWPWCHRNKANTRIKRRAHGKICWRILSPNSVMSVTPWSWPHKIDRASFQLFFYSVFYSVSPQRSSGAGCALGPPLPNNLLSTPLLITPSSIWQWSTRLGPLNIILAPWPKSHPLSINLSVDRHSFARSRDAWVNLLRSSPSISSGCRISSPNGSALPASLSALSINRYLPTYDWSI